MDDSYRASKSVREAFAKILDRVTDRLLPERCDKQASAPTKYLGTAAGLGAWCLYGILRHMPMDGQKALEGEFGPLPADWPALVYLSIAAVAISMWICIVKSFSRGGPLSFFFWGLIFPTIALNVLRFAFR